MNRAFVQATGRYHAYKDLAATLSHTQRVTRLYRASLKLLVSWWPDREILNEQACLIRESFEANRGASVEQGAARRLVRETEETIDLWIHPDKYTIPYMPGSSKFMRNAPPPLEAVYPHGIPAEIAEQVIPIHPDGIPYSYRPNNEPLLIDPMSKKIL